MRGERTDMMSNISRGVATSKDGTTPSTPGSTNMRQHPPSFQRMHSNESRGSDKDSANGRD